VDKSTQNSRGRIASAASVTAPVIDLVTFGGFIFMTPWLGEQLFSQSPSNHLILVPGFVLMIAGAVSIRSLPNYSIEEKAGPSVLGVCLAFVLLIAYLLLYTHATDLGGSPKNNDGYAVVIFFVVMIPYFGAFCTPVTRAEPGSRKALVASSIGLISVNFLSLIGAAVWGQFVTLPTKGGSVHATGIWFLILFGILYLLFLVFFGLPRIYLLRATGDRIGLGMYLVGVAVYLWDKIPPLS
jgi:hypothetical protein